MQIELIILIISVIANIIIASLSVAANIYICRISNSETYRKYHKHITEAELNYRLQTGDYKWFVDLIKSGNIHNYTLLSQRKIGKYMNAHIEDLKKLAEAYQKAESEENF